MPVARVSRLIRDTLVRQVKGAGDVVATTVDVTREITSAALRGFKGGKSETPRVTKDAVEGAVRAGSDTGTELGAVAKGAVIGVVQGVGDVTKVTAGVLGDAAAAAVRATAEVGGDVAAVARKAVEGAIEAGRQAGLKAEDAASAGATGALAAAGEVSETVVRAVTRALSGTISGVRVVTDFPTRKPVILVANGNRRDLELLSQQLSKEGYRVLTAASGEEVDGAIEEEGGKVSLVLVDVSSFDEGVWDHCERLREARTPFLVISGKRSPTIQQEAMKCGASGVLIKPLGVRELVGHVRSLIGD